MHHYTLQPQKLLKALLTKSILHARSSCEKDLSSSSLTYGNKNLLIPKLIRYIVTVIATKTWNTNGELVQPDVWRQQQQSAYIIISLAEDLSNVCACHIPLPTTLYHSTPDTTDRPPNSLQRQPAPQRRIRTESTL